MEGSHKTVHHVALLWIPDFLQIFQFGYLSVNAYIPIDYYVSQWGIAMVMDIFVCISKTVSQIHFKCGGDLPWIGAYCVCSYGHAPMIFLFHMNFFIHFWRAFILITRKVNGACKVNGDSNVN